ncbi:MAG: hypothetical protein M3Y55_00100, partial [Pseudomonadota bacterium]|nr:hypothetical protein [Pseudomonadota bacterium]
MPVFEARPPGHKVDVSALVTRRLKCLSQAESTANALRALGFEAEPASAAPRAIADASSAAPTARILRLTLLT